MSQNILSQGLEKLKTNELLPLETSHDYRDVLELLNSSSTAEMNPLPDQSHSLHHHPQQDLNSLNHDPFQYEQHQNDHHSHQLHHPQHPQQHLMNVPILMHNSHQQHQQQSVTSPHLSTQSSTISYYQPNVHHLNETPCLEDYDTDYKFEVEVPMDEKEKKLWYYDAPSKRLFVKGDQPLSAYVSFERPPSNQNLYVRLMPVYTSRADVRRPVSRCPNHKEQCKTANREHIVHCLNKDAEYKGTETGETFIERLSVRIPLKQTLQCREEIVFSFMCLNSCSGISRRPTTLIFTLENDNFEILGRTVMNFRACTSPKRDFETDRKKRGMVPSVEDVATQPSAKRPMIVKNADGSKTTIVKTEPEFDSQDSEPASPSGECLVTIKMPSKALSLKLVQYAQDMLSGEATRGNSVNKKFFKAISKQIDELTKDLEKV